MLDEILIEIFSEATFGRLNRSRRAQLIARMFFGFLGAALGIAGALTVPARFSANTALNWSMSGVFVFLACFFLFNVALARKWRWPGVFFVLSFISMFVTRILFGR